MSVCDKQDVELASMMVRPDIPRYIRFPSLGAAAPGPRIVIRLGKGGECGAEAPRIPNSDTTTPNKTAWCYCYSGLSISFRGHQKGLSYTRLPNLDPVRYMYATRRQACLLTSSHSETRR